MTDPVSIASPRDPAGRPSSLTRVAFTPGAKPTLPGPYVAFDHSPAEAVALLDAAIPRPPAPYKRHRLRTPLLTLIVALVVAAVVADRAAGFGRWTFTQVLGPAAAAALLLVMLATHSRPALALSRLRKISVGRVAAIVGVSLLVALVGGMVLLAVSDTPAAAMRRLAVLLVAVWFLAAARALRDGPESALTRRESAQVERMTACRDIVAALADDVAAGKKVAGWADLTGAQQPGKLLAHGTAASGAKVELFRDEWFSLTAPLRDGTRLRLVASDREKYKHPHFRSRNGKTKRKPGATQTLSTLEVRLRVNPRVYRTLTPESQAGPGPALHLASMEATPGAVSAVFTRSEGLHLAEVMPAVAHVYRHLERLPAGGGGGS